jgi:hypothetical protein
LRADVRRASAWCCVDRRQAQKAEEEQQVVILEEIADEQAVENANIRLRELVVRKANRMTPSGG